MKTFEIFMAVILVVMGFAVFGAFFDAITNLEAIALMVGCVITLAAVVQLPAVKNLNQ